MKNWFTFIITTFLGCLCITLALYFTSLDKYYSALANKEAELSEKENKINEIEDYASGISEQLFLSEKENLNLREKYINNQDLKPVLGVSTDENYPFMTPSSGYLESYNQGFGGILHGSRHYGIDITTRVEDRNGSKGNQVYSACNGTVVKFDIENGAVMIQCDSVDKKFSVPEYDGLITYYGHMADKDTRKSYIVVSQDQKVQKGQLLGYQGNLSAYYPGMENVHLHFSIFKGNSEIEGALNPCLYIGGDCATQGSEFKVN